MSGSDSSIDFATVLASAAHDMKNSLCLLIQSIDNLQQQQQQLDGNGREELSRIHYEANRLNINLLQLLSLYRIEKISYLCKSISIIFLIYLKKFS